MVAELVAFRGRAHHDGGRLRHDRRPEHEERRRRTGRGKHVEDELGVRMRGAVVERQRDELAVRLDRFHHGHAGIMTRRDYTVAMPSKEEVLEALSQVEDPELGMDVVDLGLVYEVEVEGPKAKVLYSLTSMGCPAGPLIAGDMERVTLEVPGVEEVELELTFDPPWTPDRMSEDAKFILGFG